MRKGCVSFINLFVVLHCLLSSGLFNNNVLQIIFVTSLLLQRAISCFRSNNLNFCDSFVSLSGNIGRLLEGRLVIAAFLRLSEVIFKLKKSKSNLHYTRAITPKRVTSGETHLCGIAPGQHSSEETLQQ